MIAEIINSYDLVDWSNPINRSHALARGLIGFWLTVPCRSGWGSYTWRDLTFAHHASLTNMEPSSDWSHDGLLFDGGASNEYVDTGSLLAEGLGALTVAGRFRLNNITQDHTLAAEGAGGNAAFLLWADDVTSDTTNDKFVFAVRPGSFLRANGATSYVTGVDYDVAGTYDGTSILIYVDGKQDGSGAASGNLAQNGVTKNTTFGGETADRFLNGRISYIAMWTRALSASEVVYLHREAHQSFPGLLNRIPLPFPFIEQVVGDGYYQLVGYDSIGVL